MFRYLCGDEKIVSENLTIFWQQHMDREKEEASTIINNIATSGTKKLFLKRE